MAVYSMKKSLDHGLQAVAASLEDLQSSSLNLVSELFHSAGMKCQESLVREQLKAVQDAGFDPSRVVFQTAPKQWWNLLPYVMGRKTEKSLAITDLLINDPSMSMGQSCCFHMHDLLAPKVNIRSTVTPLVVLFARSMNSDNLKNGTNHFDRYKDRLERMVARGLDVHATDSQGNNALHAVLQNVPTESCEAWITMMMDAGVSVDTVNVHGKTPVMLAQDRISKEGPLNQPPIRAIANMLETKALHNVVQDLPIGLERKARQRL